MIYRYQDHAKITCVRHSSMLLKYDRMKKSENNKYKHIIIIKVDYGKLEGNFFRSWLIKRRKAIEPLSDMTNYY